MMWPNFFLQDREQRIAMRRRGETQRPKVLTDEQEGKIKLAFFVAIVGMTLTVLAVGTEFWVELNTYKQNHSAICEAAHFGLWKFCYKKLWVYDVGEERDTCGPAELPGEANCSYFKFFTTGENANIFLRTTKKGSAAPASNLASSKFLVAVILNALQMCWTKPIISWTVIHVDWGLWKWKSKSFGKHKKAKA